MLKRQNISRQPAFVPPTDELDKLITDRPESCRRKPLDPGMTRLPGCPAGLSLAIPTQVQPPPIVTLSLPCLPMHQHHQLQAQLQAQARLAPMSPAPAQTPPLHTVPDLSHSPLTQQPGKPPDDFYSVHGDTHTEVDALDPSIMDFALQGIKSAKVSYSCQVKSKPKFIYKAVLTQPFRRTKCCPVKK